MKKLGFGCMRLPLLNADDQTSFDTNQINNMVDAFLERGFTYFDTAYVYHGGRSEVAVRDALVKRHRRDAFQLATKLPPRILKAAEDQPRIFSEQLEKCGVDFFDYYLVHNIGTSSYEQARKYGTFDFVQQMKREGRIRNVGMSFHDAPELLDEVLSAHPELDFVQLQINYIDWDNPGIQARRCYETARKHNMPIVVMEPVKGGSLAWAPAAAEKLMKACDPEASIASWAVRYAAGLDGVFMVLSGMSTLDQVIDNTSYMVDFKPLNAAERSIIEQVTAILNADSAIACTTCRYCEDGCPANIAIPDYFALYNNAMRSPTKTIASQFVYYMNLTASRGKASDCVECGQCEAACPQHLPIAEHLKVVGKAFESMALPG